MASKRIFYTLVFLCCSLQNDESKDFFEKLKRPDNVIFLVLFPLFLRKLEKLPLCPCANKTSKTIHCLKTYQAERQQFLMINKLRAERELLHQFSLFCPLFSAVLLMYLFRVFILCINEP